MFRSLRTTSFSLLFSLALLLFGATTSARAQTYPIDCAILLCLSGGWPNSVPCSRARAEFIRRITPWPIEPPLQIWRCPMGASYLPSRNNKALPKVFDILFTENPDMLQHPVPKDNGNAPLTSKKAFAQRPLPSRTATQQDALLYNIEHRADIDISGSEFDFVRSIRVFDVRETRQYVAGREGGCVRVAMIYLGTYSTQGGFSWQRSNPEALPSAHSGLERWGIDCPYVSHRSVFVDWHDYKGNYGFEQVDY